MIVNVVCETVCRVSFPEQIDCGGCCGQTGVSKARDDDGLIHTRRGYLIKRPSYLEECRLLNLPLLANQGEMDGNSLFLVDLLYSFDSDEKSFNLLHYIQSINERDIIARENVTRLWREFKRQYNI
jgi:hypothetical protein